MWLKCLARLATCSANGSLTWCPARLISNEILYFQMVGIWLLVHPSWSVLGINIDWGEQISQNLQSMVCIMLESQERQYPLICGIFRSWNSIRSPISAKHGLHVGKHNRDMWTLTCIKSFDTGGLELLIWAVNHSKRLGLVDPHRTSFVGWVLLGVGRPWPNLLYFSTLWRLTFAMSQIRTRQLFIQKELRPTTNQRKTHS